MKKIVFLSASLLFILTISYHSAKAQRIGNTYHTAIGLGIDFGDETTGAGFSIKHFFTLHDAGEANIIFYNRNTTGVNALYEYNGMFTGASGLMWYIGLGPQFYFSNNSTQFGGRPLLGLEYKIANVPIDFAIDWRPYVQFTNEAGFTAARFQFAFRYAF